MEEFYLEGSTWNQNWFLQEFSYADSPNNPFSLSTRMVYSYTLTAEQIS